MPNSGGTIALGNEVRYYLYGPGLPTTGLLRYRGVIDTIKPHINENGGESVDVTITPYSQLLGDHSIIGPIAYGTPGSSGTYVDTGTIFSNLLGTTDAITSTTYLSPFTLDGTNPATTGNKVACSFQNQTLLSAITTILLLSPSNYFIRMNEAAQTITFNSYPTTANYYLLLGQHITSMEYALDNVSRKNMIGVQGKGVFAKAVGTSAVSTNSNYIGERSYFKSDNRITDVNTAQTLANGLLAFYDRTQIRTKIKIPDYRGDRLTGLGYDIEQFKVGQTVVILDAKAPPITLKGKPSTWGNFTWGTNQWSTTPSQLAIWGTFVWGQTNWGFSVGNIFNTVAPIVAINYLYNAVELEIGFRQPAWSRALYALESKYNDSSLVS